MPKKDDFQSGYVEKVFDCGVLILDDEYKGTKVKHNLQCVHCEGTWITTPLAVTQAFKKFGTNSCPYCNNNRKETRYLPLREQKINNIESRGLTILTPDYDGKHLDSNNKVLVKNDNCGHEFETSIANLACRGVSCPVCAKSQRVAALLASSQATHDDFMLRANEWQIYKSKVSVATEKVYRDNIELINPNGYSRGISGEKGAYHLDHIVSRKSCFYYNIPPEICAHIDNLRMIPWEQNLAKKDKMEFVPSIFNEYFDLLQPKRDFINRLTQEIDCSFKSDVVVEGVFVDVLYESHKVALIFIDFDQDQIGANKSRNQNFKLYLMDKGYTVFVIFEDEVVYKWEIIKHRLNYALKQTTPVKISPRDCEIRSVVSETAKRELLYKNHIQGDCKTSSIKIGAYYNDELVALMTFSVNRDVVKMKQQSGVYELVRFVVDLTYSIPGIFGKLLSAFKRNNDWVEIVSFADLRWGTGNIYQQNGFTLLNKTSPSYFYVQTGIRRREQRYKFMKHKLKQMFSNYDERLTEYEMVTNNGYKCFWDCGTYKFSLTNPNVSKSIIKTSSSIFTNDDF